MANTTRTGFAPVSAPKKKNWLRKSWDFSKNSKGGRAVESSVGWVSGHWKISIIIFVLIAFGILSLIFGLTNVFSNILWWAAIIFIGVLSYLQFKNDKVQSGIFFLIVVIILMAYRIGLLGNLPSLISDYYDLWLPGLPFWFFIFAIILLVLALYNLKKGKAGVAVLIVALVFISWIFLPYIQDVVAPKIEATSIGGGITSGLMKIKLWFANPEKFKRAVVERSEFGPEIKEKEPMKGVKVMEFNPIYNNFLPGKPVDLRGKVHIDAIKNPTGSGAKVSLYCEAEDKNKNIKKGLIRVDGVNDKFIDKSEVSVSRSGDYKLWCQFKNGFSVEVGKEVSTVTARLAAVYDDFVTTTKLSISTVSSDVIINNPEEIEEKVKRRYGTSGEAIPSCISGCALTKLSLSTSKQPLLETVAYKLDVRLLKASDWYGKPIKIESVELITKPAKVTLEEDCDFVQGKISERIARYNQDLEKNKDVDLVFYCDFKVNPDEEFETSFFRVDAKYDYAVKAERTVTIIKEREA